MLMPSTIQTVKEWRYTPFFIEGQPVEADIPIQIAFTLIGQ